MKSIPPALASHLLGESTTLAICWLIRKSNGGYIRGTEHDRNIEIHDVGSPTTEVVGTYIAQANITGSDVRSTSDLSVDNMEVEGALSDEVVLTDITVQEIEAGVLDHAPVTVFLCNWRQPDAGHVILRRGHLGTMSRDSDGRYKTEVRGLAQLLAQNIGQNYSERCNVVRFGDSRCGFNAESLRIYGTVIAVESRKVFTVGFGSPAPTLPMTWATGGEVTFTTGALANFTFQIKRTVRDGSNLEVELWEEASDDIQVGDEANGIPGCDRTWSTCKFVYANVANFRGFGLYIPGAMALLRGPQGTMCPTEPEQNDQLDSLYEKFPGELPQEGVGGVPPSEDLETAPPGTTLPGGGTGTGTGDGGAYSGTTPTSRNVYQLPFSEDSIWNTPIGSGAQWHDPAFTGLTLNPSGYREEGDIVVLKPSSPSTAIAYNRGSFDVEGNRCPVEGETFGYAGVPTSWTYTEGALIGDVKVNGCGVFLKTDGRTLMHTYATARCTAGQPVTTRTVLKSWPPRADHEDIYGSGRAGQQGGTHLSSLGGCLRVGEMTRANGAPMHALRHTMYQGAQYRPSPLPASGFNYADHGEQYTFSASTWWVYPAYSGDDPKRYLGTDIYVRPGALYAIPPFIDIDDLGLETEPARMLAWTLQNFGTYCCDTSPAEVWGWAMETGPDGNFWDTFEDEWGFSPIIDAYAGGMATLRDHAWVRDNDRIVNVLQIVTNNLPSTPAGGGTPRIANWPPPFA